METGPWSSATERKTTYAIADDLSGVIPTSDGFGIFTTEGEALASLILRLESDLTETRASIARAKRRQRALKRITA